MGSRLVVWACAGIWFFRKVSAHRCWLGFEKAGSLSFWLEEATDHEAIDHSAQSSIEIGMAAVSCSTIVDAT